MGSCSESVWEMGGHFIVMTEQDKWLSPEQAAGMTVNERLWVAGLTDAYDEAVAVCDYDQMAEILKKIHLDSGTIKAIIRFEKEKK